MNVDIDNDQSKLSAEGAVSIRERDPHKAIFAITSVDNLKRKSVRGGAISLVAQGLKFGVQMGSVMILARLLSPEDFGLQGMVVTMMGIIGLFKDGGLSIATVQRDVITHEQTSTLFWINVGLGAVLTLITAAMAPALVAFYNEPRLYWVVIVSGTAFMFNSLGTQHGALLQRGMRYVTLAKIDILSLAVSSAVGIGMAALGFGYWALVGMAVCGPLVSTAGSWFAVSWLPGRPMRRCGVRSMLHFGGTITCNNLVIYLGYNAEKVLLGRSWGAQALGLYGRSYQLLNLPMQLHSSMYTVAFSAISRIQNNAELLCRSFLKGYSVLLSLIIPITLASALFAEEIIRTVLGPKWIEAAPILRLLTPAVLIFAMINPFGWFLTATGRTGRSLKIALLIAPTVILGIGMGLRYGPKGVALGYSIAMSFLLVPVIAWNIHGTGITPRTFWQATQKPLLSGLLAAACGLVFKMTLGHLLTPISCLIFGLGLVFLVYAFILLVAMGQRELYVDLLNQIFQRVHPNPEETKSV